MKQVVLKHGLTARPETDDFDVIDAPRPACPEGGVVIAVSHVSLDPYVGSRLRGRHMGEAPPLPGVEAIPGGGVGQIIESRAPGFAPGEWVHSMEVGWRAEADLAPGHFRKIEVGAIPASAHVGVLGMPGLTAWAGMTQLAKVGPGDVVLVDAAAGAVGGTVGQIARLQGASKVIGIAGGAEKCRLVTETYGFDACVDYKLANWTEALDVALPAPPTVYFENVSAQMAITALSRMAIYGRMVLCGLVDQYHADAPPPGLPLGLIIGKRAAVMGLVVYDFYPRWDEYVGAFGPHVASGRLKIAEDMAQGLENASALFERLMRGENVGKAVVAV
jgi:NADPH-dependent curcumin reductase